MRHSIIKFFTAFLLVGLLIICSSIYTYAEGTLTISAAQSEYGPKEKVEITVQELDENQQPVTGISTVKVRISRGGFTDQGILKNGLTLKNGTGKFIFITPSKPGNADILVINPANNLSAKLSLQINEITSSNEWKSEFATISKIKGKVAVKYSGKNTWDSALLATKLHEYDTIMTWDKSWTTLQLFDGSELVLQPCTTLYIKSLKSSTSATPVKQSVFKLLTGKVLAKAKEYLEKGSKFEIESESATAGVKGTYFEFGAFVDGACELIVYEGSVFMEQLQQELLYAVQAGQRLLLQAGNPIPEINPHSINPEQRDKTLADEEAAAEPDPDQNDDDQQGDQGDVTGDLGGENPFQQPPQGTKSNTNLRVGSEMIGSDMYFTLHFQPEFRKLFGTGIGLGLDLTLYQDSDGIVRIGGPVAGEISNFIRWVEFDGKNLYFRYGDLVNLTYDAGLLFNNYSKYGAKGFQLGLKGIPIDNLGFKVLVPFDVTSFSPWEIEQTSTLYAGRIYYDTKLLGLPLEFGGTYVMDTNNQLPTTVPSSGLAVDCIMPLSSLATPYAEVASLAGFGAGAELGIKGNILSLIKYQTGLRFVTDKFIPNYFGADYEMMKYNTIYKSILNSDADPSNDINGRELPDLSDVSKFGASTGYYFNANLGLFSWANLNVRYENYDNMGGYAPILTGKLDVNIPKVFSLPEISAGIAYQQYQFKNFSSLLNENTTFSWFVKYPISEGISALIINTYDPKSGSDNPVFTTSMTMSMDF